MPSVGGLECTRKTDINLEHISSSISEEIGGQKAATPLKTSFTAAPGLDSTQDTMPPNKNGELQGESKPNSPQTEVTNKQDTMQCKDGQTPVEETAKLNGEISGVGDETASNGAEGCGEEGKKSAVEKRVEYKEKPRASSLDILGLSKKKNCKIQQDELAPELQTAFIALKRRRSAPAKFRPTDDEARALEGKIPEEGQPEKSADLDKVTSQMSKIHLDNKEPGFADRMEGDKQPSALTSKGPIKTMPSVRPAPYPGMQPCMQYGIQTPSYQHPGMGYQGQMESQVPLQQYVQHQPSQIYINPTGQQYPAAQPVKVVRPPGTKLAAPGMKQSNQFSSFTKISEARVGMNTPALYLNSSNVPGSAQRSQFQQTPRGEPVEVTYNWPASPGSSSQLSSSPDHQMQTAMSPAGYSPGQPQLSPVQHQMSPGSPQMSPGQMVSSGQPQLSPGQPQDMSIAQQQIMSPLQPQQSPGQPFSPPGMPQSTPGMPQHSPAGYPQLSPNQPQPSPMQHSPQSVHSDTNGMSTSHSSPGSPEFNALNSPHSVQSVESADSGFTSSGVNSPPHVNEYFSKNSSNTGTVIETAAYQYNRSLQTNQPRSVDDPEKELKIRNIMKDLKSGYPGPDVTNANVTVQYAHVQQQQQYHPNRQPPLNRQPRIPQQPNPPTPLQVQTISPMVISNQPRANEYGMPNRVPVQPQMTAQAQLQLQNMENLVNTMSLDLLCSQDEEEDTALHIAISQGERSLCSAIIRRLVQSGRTDALNIKDREGQTPLYVAVVTNQPNLIYELLENGADIMIANKEGTTPLHYASMKGYACALQAIGCSLYRRNWNINVDNKHGMSALQCAIQAHGRYEQIYDGNECRYTNKLVDSTDTIVNLLVLGADPAFQDKRSGYTALHFAVELAPNPQVTCNAIIIQRILQVSDNAMELLNITNYAGNTALHIIAGRDYDEDYMVKIINLLISYGADISLKNPDRNTPHDIVVNKEKRRKVCQRLQGDHLQGK